MVKDQFDIMEHSCSNELELLATIFIVDGVYPSSCMIT